MISNLETALNNAKSELAKADVDNLATIRNEIENLSNSVNAEIDNLEKALEQVESELLGQIGSLKKALKIITSILGIVLLLTATGVIVLTIKGKRD